MTEPGISLCTCTCDEADFVLDLLASLRDWQIRPEEIVVVDDGSREPFAPGRPWPGLRVIRLDKRHGHARARGAAISAARGAVILSLDCDTRLAPDWLAVSLPNLMRSGVGLAGGAVVGASGRDLVSRFLERYGDPAGGGRSGPAELIPGEALLIRRSTWQKSGGFSGHAGERCEDQYLCRLLASRGYTLYSDARARAVRLRPQSRAALCERLWHWHGQDVKAQMPPDGRTLPYLVEVCVRPMLERFASSISAGEPLFLYLDLLYAVAAALDCLEHARDPELVTQAVRDGFLRRLGRLFEGFPRLFALFRADLSAQGLRALMPASGDEDAWAEFFVFAELMRNSGLFDWLERSGVDALAREDRSACALSPLHEASHLAAVAGPAQ